MTVHTIGFMYAPKEQAVRDGTCRHTIRKESERRIKYAGDEAILHGWTGRAYHSPWSWRRREVIQRIQHYKMTPYVLVPGVVEYWDGSRRFVDGPPVIPEYHSWTSEYADALARLDGIDPPTGIELKDVLRRMGAIKEDCVMHTEGILW